MRTLIIAEAGVNHNGNFEIAKQLVDVAADSGADFVKFQTFKANKLVSKTAVKADYQVRNINDGDSSQFVMLKKLEMPEAWHYDLKEYAESKKIRFLSTGFDEDSVDFLDQLGIELFKIPSGEITNKPYLEHIAEKGKPIILSTGMSDMDEIKVALDVIMTKGIKKDMITVLHCNTEYPTPMGDVNLLAMISIQKKFGVRIGYSDHTIGIEVPIAAVALGAGVIEKHFTLDRTMEGPDHLASLEPQELHAMISAIRNIELAISGNSKKTPSQSEIGNRIIARKSLHLAKSVGPGHILAKKDIEIKRPGDGISPMLLDEIIGKRIKTELPDEHKLSFGDFE